MSGMQLLVTQNVSLIIEFNWHFLPITDQQSAMMKTDAGTCASLSVSLLTTSSRLSNHFLLYTPIDLRFRLYQQSDLSIYDKASLMTHLLTSAWCKRIQAWNVFMQKDDILNI